MPLLIRIHAAAILAAFSWWALNEYEMWFWKYQLKNGEQA